MIRQSMIRQTVTRPALLHALTAFLMVAFAAVTAALAQPGQPAPVQPTLSMQDGNLKPALPGALRGVGIDQKLDRQVPLDLIFRDEFGKPVPLATFFHPGKPVLLAPVYYRCPMLCTQILNGVASTLKAVSLTPGKDFEVVAFSFDPKDTPETAAAKKQQYLKRFGRAGTANGWHLLTGAEPNIKALTEALGYHYKYDSATDQFAHASGLMLLTGEGRISRYFYGVEYAPRDIRLGLVEASKNQIGSPVDQVLLFCFHYDPATGKYGAVAMNLVRFAGAFFVLIGGAFLIVVWRRDLRAHSADLRAHSAEPRAHSAEPRGHPADLRAHSAEPRPSGSGAPARDLTRDLNGRMG